MDGHAYQVTVLCDEYTWCIWSPEMYLFIGLYMVYGVVFGLGSSVQQLVGDGDGAPAVLQDALWWFAWSPLVAVVAAPVVAAVHVPYVGRRKTWIVGGQYGVGAVMLLMLPVCGSVTNGDDLPLGPGSAALLALFLGVLHLLATAHEIAVDSWGKSYVHHNALALCCSLGRALGMFVGDTLFQSLQSATFCNTYLRVAPSDTGIMSLGLFLWLCGLFMITAATAILLGFSEHLVDPTTDPQPPVQAAPVGDVAGGGGGVAHHAGADGDSTSIEGADVIGDMYGKLFDVFRLAPVRLLIICLATMQVGCGVERLSSDRMISLGLNKDHVVFTRRLSDIVAPIFVRLYLCDQNVIHPLPATVNALKYRMLFGQVFTILIWLMPDVRLSDSEGGRFPFIFNFVALTVHGLHQVTMTAMFVSLLSFFYKVSDATVGGMYMTVLKTAFDFGAIWPSSVGEWLAARLTWHGCLVPKHGCVKYDSKVSVCAEPLAACALMDGLLVAMVVCFVAGISWLYVSQPLVDDLQSARADSWSVDSLVYLAQAPSPRRSRRLQPRRQTARSRSRSPSRSRSRSPSRGRRRRS